MSVPAPLNANNIGDFLEFWLTNDVLSAESQAVLDRYYASYKRNFGLYVKHWYSRQTEELTNLIHSLSHPTVLEVGCGCGTESLWAAMRGAEVVGIDIADDLLKAAQERKEWLQKASGRELACDFRKMSILSTDGLGPFDIVYMEQAFHHLEPRAEVLRKTAELVRAGGWLVISEANAWNPLLQLNLLRVRGTTTIASVDGHPWGHERITVPAALLRQFGKRDFARVQLTYYRTLPNMKLGDRLLSLDRRIPQWLKPLFTHYNLVLRKSDKR